MSVAEAKILGYDGMTRGEGPGKEWVVFSSDQIKSATGNRGTFDTGNKNVQYQLKDGKAPPENQPPEDGLDRGRATGSPPRVDENVDNLRAAEAAGGLPPKGLARDVRKSWASMDPKVKEIIRTYPSQKYLDLVKSGHQLRPEETQAHAAIVQGKKEAWDAKLEHLNNLRAEKSPMVNEAAKEAMVANMDYVAHAAAYINDGTGTARALAARARLMKAATSDPEGVLIRKMMAEIKGVSDKSLSSLLDTWKNNPSEFSDQVRVAMHFSNLDKAIEIWRAGLLSSFVTDLRNISGNVSYNMMHLVKEVAAIGVDFGVSKITGQTRERYMADVGAEVAGSMTAFPDAMKNLLGNFRDIVTLKDKPIDLTHKFEHSVGKVGGRFGKIVRTSFKKLEAEDQFFKEVIAGGELRKGALRMARKEGKVGKAMHDRAADIVKDFRSHPENYSALMATVEAAKLKRTFQNTPSKMAQSLLQFRRKHRWMQVVLPFLQTPANILSETVAHTPIGFLDTWKAGKVWREAFKAGESTPEELSQMRADFVDKFTKASTGTALLAGFGTYAAMGGMTGSGPNKKQDRDILRATGWQPYSFVVQDSEGKKHYISYSSFEPVSSLLGIAADMAEAKDQETKEDMAAKALGAVAQNIVNKSYLEGLANAVQFMAEPGRIAPAYMSSLVGSLVPNLVARSAVAIDPVLREIRPTGPAISTSPERVVRTLMSRIPGLSQRLPAKVDPFGQDIVRPGNSVMRFLSPVTISDEKSSASVGKALANADYAPEAPSKTMKIKGEAIPLTAEEYAPFQAARQKATERVKRLAASPSFAAKDPEDQKKKIRAIFEEEADKVRSHVKNQVARRVRDSGR